MQNILLPQGASIRCTTCERVMAIAWNQVGQNFPCTLSFLSLLFIFGSSESDYGLIRRNEGCSTKSEKKGMCCTICVAHTPILLLRFLLDYSQNGNSVQ